jgi:hypothetical protein
MESDLVELEAREYFEQITKGKPELPLLKKPCSDCAVLCGFYDIYIQGLKAKPKELQEKVAKTWYCHNNLRQACRGNADALGINW